MFRAVTLIALIALIALASAAGSAGAAPKTKLVELRVEGDGETLDPGTWYATGTQHVKRGRTPECEARKRTTRFPGANALTALASGQVTNPALTTVRTRPTDFGQQVCQIGDLRSFGTYPSPNAGFLYYVNFASGFSAPNDAPVANGDSVLWHYSVFPSDPPAGGDPPSVNTGCALQLKDVPAHDADGQFVVEVAAHGFGCSSTATGVTIMGVESSVAAGGGEYEVTVGAGKSELFAARENDVRSNRFEVCVGEAEDCPAAHGRTIVGSRKDDRLRATEGDDVVRGGAGDDRIILRGGHDRANCGRGRDVVRLKRGSGADRIRGNCEEVRRT